MSSSDSPLYIGIDVGGTFTDLIFFDSNSTETSVLKLPTSGKNPEDAILKALTGFEHKPTQVRLINHATTMATNALLTRSGLAKTALITNHGFRDVIEIGRQRRPEIYNLYTQRPRPLVKRADRFTMSGRMLSDGSELEKIDESKVRKLGKKLAQRNFDCVVVGLLNSYANPAHEKSVQRILRKAGFRGEVVLSSSVSNEYREYERFSTAVVNASLVLPVSRYLSSLSASLGRAGYSSPVYVMNSDGNVSTIDHASKFPLSIIESGPAAGVLACVDLATSLSLSRVATFDMGGTTAKAGMVIDYQPDIAYEFEAAGKTHSGRSVKGSGYPVRHPFIDLAEVSTGGGTIAWVDEGKALRLGPQSAGSEPGPAAYGKGGTEPTVTDANVILGRLNPDYLLGGKMVLHKELAHKALKERIADMLGVDVASAAHDVLRVVNHCMARAISIVSVERARDPRDFTLVAFGGAGPLHACDLAEEMSISHVVIPPHPGIFSAYGLLTVDLARTFSMPVLSTNLDVSRHLEKLKREASKALAHEGFSAFSLEESVDLRYQGQSFETTLPYKERNELRKRFDRQHKELYGYSLDDSVEVVNAKVRATVAIPKIARRKQDVVHSNPTPSMTREAWISQAYVDAPVFERENIQSGAEGSGPCIIEEYDSTTVVNSDWSWRIDEYGNLHLRRQKT